MSSHDANVEGAYKAYADAQASVAQINEQITSPQAETDNQERLTKALADQERTRIALVDKIKAAGELPPPAAASAPAAAPATPAPFRPGHNRQTLVPRGRTYEAGQFRCIYGGFFIEKTQSCKVSKFSDSGIALQNSKIKHPKSATKDADLNGLSCEAKPLPKKTKLHFQGPKTALCNPFEFGLYADGSAICVPAGKYVSNNCKNALVGKNKNDKKAEIAKEWAQAIRSQNPDVARTMDHHQARICSNDAFNQERNRGANIYSNKYLTAGTQIEDVKETCGILQKQVSFLGVTLPSDAIVAIQPVPAAVPAAPAAAR